MIVRAARYLRREVEGIHAAAYVLGASALISSLLALFRDRLFAHTFGAGLELDIYFAAFRVPDLIFVLIASLMSAYALIPALAKRNDEDRARYIETITLCFGVLMVGVSLLAYMVLPNLLVLLFPDLSRASSDLLSMARILLLQPLFLGFSNILAAITQTRRQYVLYALAPVTYNMGIIGGLIILYPLMGVSGLVWGVVVGSVFHALIQLPSAFSAGFFSRVPRIHNIRVFWETIALSLPRTITLGVGQVVQILLLVIAGTFAPGSITVFMFAFNLQAVPLAVIGASYSVAAFPTLSRMVSEGNLSLFVDQVVIAARHILFWTMPAAALMIILRAHVVRTILGSGVFDWTDTRLTAASFAFFSFALAAQAFSLLIIRAYYAAGRSYVPLVVSVGSGCVTITLSLFMVFSYVEEGVARFFLESLLRVEDVPGTIILLLPFAYAVGATIGAVTFVILFERHFGGFASGISRVFWESLTASGCASTLAYATLSFLGGIGPATTLSAVLTHGAVAGLVGIIGAGMVYWFFGSPELYEAFATLKRRPRAVAPPVQSTEETIT